MCTITAEACQERTCIRPHRASNPWERTRCSRTGSCEALAEPVQGIAGKRSSAGAGVPRQAGRQRASTFASCGRGSCVHGWDGKGHNAGWKVTNHREQSGRDDLVRAGHSRLGVPGTRQWQGSHRGVEEACFPRPEAGRKQSVVSVRDKSVAPRAGGLTQLIAGVRSPYRLVSSQGTAGSRGAGWVRSVQLGAALPLAHRRRWSFETNSRGP